MSNILWTSERLLAYEVFAEMFEDYCKLVRNSFGLAKARVREIEDWLKTDDGTFGFPNVCSLIGLDEDAARGVFRKIKSGTYRGKTRLPRPARPTRKEHQLCRSKRILRSLIGSG